jgi:hypothetical protein
MKCSAALKAYIFTGEALVATGAVEDAMKLSLAREYKQKWE